MNYAKEQDNRLVEPTDAEFVGIPNWWLHDYQLRKRGYMPLVGEAEPREGYTAKPLRWHVEGDGNTAYIQIDDWDYMPIPAPEPEPLRRQFTKGELLESLMGCNLYDQAKAIYAADLDLQIAWAGFADIDMDYPAARGIMAQYPELFSAENVLRLQQYIAEHTNI